MLVPEVTDISVDDEKPICNVDKSSKNSIYHNMPLSVLDTNDIVTSPVLKLSSMSSI